MLSLLSYTPFSKFQMNTNNPAFGSAKFAMVGLPGFEPETSRLSGVRSNQLSYRPETI